MRERPILFKGPMVRAILEGRKTQTRRAVHPRHLRQINPGVSGCRPHWTNPMPFGHPGDRLWVRETHAIFPTHGQHRADGERWGPWGGLPTAVSPDGRQIAYFREGFDRCDPGSWHPSIHMPRWACRLVLEITDVRVERLQEISDADALAEGIQELNGRYTYNGGLQCRTAVGSFCALWESTGGDWEANPWVWVIGFKRVEGIDQ
ncbi:hypothetical protein [Stenotrophomonas sp. MMGLT7]|uniref:hypothetical protein n=1 Tax=Stenotrophomonas sp. MMGLT7 TaxID=2901227 RepID=UPI001E338C7D|nr:hypothetical protein [Stenotrophomonas sp. MMGLT7]MCD7096899.1 hypothetical protein [Stenotrophomonas sp. MMGLT7]